jgi:hypothetical protein
MTERLDKETGAGLDAFFDAARAHPPAVPGDLLARVAADAAAVAADRARSAPVAAQPRGWRGILSGIGGWPALAGLATATVAGVWIGYSAPDLGSTLSSMALSDGAEASYDIGGLLPGYVAAEDWSL